MQAKFSHLRDWVFDLDNTLYPPSIELFAQIDKRMTRFIAAELDISSEAAHRLQKTYWAEHGTTLAGLMEKHHVAPQRFLDMVHDIDLSVLNPDTALRDAIAALPGRKFIFTNGTRRHAENVAARLGVLPLFDDIFDIIAAAYIPKPNPSTYPLMLARFGVATKSAGFFEDLARNLAPAHALGMTTIWVRPPMSDTPETDDEFAYERVSQHGAATSDYIDHITDDLPQFLRDLT